MVVVERFLPCCLWHGHGKLSARNLVAEDYVADGIAGFGTAEPYVENGIDMLVFPRKNGGTAGEVEQNDGLAQRHEFA